MLNKVLGIGLHTSTRFFWEYPPPLGHTRYRLIGHCSLDNFEIMKYYWNFNYL